MSDNHTQLVLSSAEHTTLLVALQYGFASTKSAQQVATEEKNVDAAVAIHSANIEIARIAHSLFQAEDGAVDRPDGTRVGSFTGNPSDLTTMIAVLVMMKWGVQRANEGKMQIPAEALETMRSELANADTLAKKLGAFVNEHSPDWSRSFAEMYHTNDSDDPVHAESAGSFFDGDAFEEFVRLVAGPYFSGGGAPHGATLQ